MRQVFYKSKKRLEAERGSLPYQLDHWFLEKSRGTRKVRAGEYKGYSLISCKFRGKGYSIIREGLNGRPAELTTLDAYFIIELCKEEGMVKIFIGFNSAEEMPHIVRGVYIDVQVDENEAIPFENSVMIVNGSSIVVQIGSVFDDLLKTRFLHQLMKGGMVVISGELNDGEPVECLFYLTEKEFLTHQHLN